MRKTKKKKTVKRAVKKRTVKLSKKKSEVLKMDQKTDSKSLGKRKRFELGDAEDTAKRDAFKIQELRPDYSSGVNVFAFVDVAYEIVQEHWFEVNGKAERVVCAVMGIEDDDLRTEKADNTYGYPEDCEPCAVMDDLYKSHPKDSGDVADERARKVASKISSKQSAYMIVAKGDLVKVRASLKSKKINTVPDFSEGLVIKKLKLSGNAFGVLYESIKEEGYTKEDLLGMPFNLVGGRKQGNSYVIDRVDFYPKHKLKKLPKNKVSLDNVAVYDPKRMDEIFGLFKKQLPDFLSGKKKMDSRSRAGARNKARAKGRRTRRR
jgi:hypothetical protein